MSDLVFFENTSPISKKCDYKFVVPKYPETTTDGSFYEPQATRIQNMKKSASSSNQGLYDFYDDEIKGNGAERYRSQVLNRLDNSVTPLGRKPGMTTEEVMSIMNRTEENIKQTSKDAEKDAKKKADSKAELLQDAKDIANAFNSESSEE